MGGVLLYVKMGSCGGSPLLIDFWLQSLVFLIINRVDVNRDWIQILEGKGTREGGGEKGRREGEQGRGGEKAEEGEEEKQANQNSL